MKIKVGVIFGGMSVEHEVAVISGLQALHALDTNQYEGIPIYITKTGEWYTGALLAEIDHYKDMNVLLQQCEKVILNTNDLGRHQLLRAQHRLFKNKPVAEIDVAFPVTHGTFGEDGALQGLLEFQKVPYVGCDVLSSAVGMDKIVMKTMLKMAGIPVTQYVWFYAKNWMTDAMPYVEQIEEQIGYPVIVKPANLGSSVGIQKADNREQLMQAVEDAAVFAMKIIVEKMIVDLKEVNCSVLGDYESRQTSVCEEVVKSSDILSYSDKYMNQDTKGMSGQSRIIPAELAEGLTEQVRALADQTFLELGCSGVSRVDLLIDQRTNDIYINEINTIPGSLSFYLWEPTGVSFSELTHRLIQLALKRERERENLTFSYETNLLAMHSKNGKFGSKN